MTPTTELSPAQDVHSYVQADEHQPPGALSRLSLYDLADDLVSLLALREEMAEEKEATDAIDGAIAEYMAALPTQVDPVAHVLLTLESQEKLAAEEVARIAARRRRIASAAERLRRYCCNILLQLPKPKNGSRKLEGSTSTLLLKGNGGVEPLDVYDESLVPEEYCTATITMPWTQYVEIPSIHIGAAKVTRSIDNAAVRKGIASQCWFCQGGPEKEGCGVCGGSGMHNVPGARLLERGHHLEIK